VSLLYKRGLILSFPVVLMIGILLIPVVRDYGDHAQAAWAVGQTGRWVAGHLTAAVAFGLGGLAVVVVHLEARQRWSFSAKAILPMAALGAVLYAAGLGADGIGPAAVSIAGGDPALFFDGSGGLVPAVFLLGTALFGASVLLVLHRFHATGGPTRAENAVAFVGAFVFMGAPAIPSGWALYLVALGAMMAFVPPAIALGRLTPSWPQAPIQ
jgi:hypothetical protein